MDILYKVICWITREHGRSVYHTLMGRLQWEQELGVPKTTLDSSDSASFVLSWTE